MISLTAITTRVESLKCYGWNVKIECKFENVELKKGEVNQRQRNHITLFCLNLICSVESVEVC